MTCVLWHNGRVTFTHIIIAIGIAFVLYVGLAGALRKFWIAPPPEPDPSNTKPVDVRYRCGVCGTEVTMTVAPTDFDSEAPRHCREDMILI